MCAEWTSDLLKEHYDERLADLSHRLDGFPQEYATLTRVDQIDASLDAIRSDHVQRREIDELKEAQAISTGRRNVLTMLVAVMLTVSTVTFTFFLTDRANFDERLKQQEEQTHVMELQVAKLQDRVAQLEGH